MAVSKYWMVYVGVFVPLFISILSVVLVLTLKPAASPPSKPRGCDTNSDCQHGGTCEEGKCQCTPQWTGDRCQAVAVPPTALQAGSARCGATPVTCSDDTSCVVCGSQGLFKCVHVDKGDTPFQVTGKYCLPVKPEDGCERDPGKGQYSEYTKGKFMWQGWQDVEAQQWTCTCPYPDYYAPAIGGEHAGACQKTPQLCAYGKWHFPCKGKQCNLSDKDVAELLTTSPLYNGHCQCDNVPCTRGDQCASGKCTDGVCEGQRLGLNPRTGVPECVPDTCAPYGKWVDTGVPPYTYGRCECEKGAVDNGYTCMPAQPDAPLCPKNCSNRGVCIRSLDGSKMGTCMCEAGYSGASCSDYTCTPNLCDTRGGCVGPNTCRCPLGAVFDPTTQTCATPASCNPPPTVNPATGDIANSDHFRDVSGLHCVGGSPEQVRALCLAAGFDGADGPGKCVRYTDCAAIPCDEPFCGPGVTSAVGPIGKRRAEDNVTCLNPSIQDVQDLCLLSGYGNNNLFLSNGQYQCVAFETSPNIALTSLRAVDGVGVEGVMCVSFASQDDFKRYVQLDGNDLFASYQVFLRKDIEALSDPGRGNAPPPVPLVNKLLRLRRMDPAPGTPCQGYYYQFSDQFLTTDARMLAAGAGTPLSIIVQAFPSTRWTCRTAETPITECTPAYSSTYYDLVLEPYTPERGISPALDPILLPEAAYLLAQSAEWRKDAFTADKVSDQVAQTVNLAKLAGTPLYAAKPDALSPVVQVACTEAYCVTGQGVAAKKLIILAWADFAGVDVRDLGLACASVRPPVSIKYNLVRTAPEGGVQTLLGPQNQVSTAMVNKQRVAYYIDVLPTNDQLKWEYTLSAYVASTPNTTYETSPCKSREQTFAVVVEPYTEQFCNSIPAPEPNQNPPYTWLDAQTGMCKWTDGNVPAIDYYCAIVKAGKRTEFPYRELELADDNFQCAKVTPSFPTFEPQDTNWFTATCDPEYELPVLKYGCVRVPPVLLPLGITVALDKLQGTGLSVNAMSELVVTVPETRVSVVVPPSTLQVQTQAVVTPKYAVCQFFVQRTTLAVTMSLAIMKRSGDPNQPAVQVAEHRVSISPIEENFNKVWYTKVDVPDTVTAAGLLSGDFQLVVSARTYVSGMSATVNIQQLGFGDTFTPPSTPPGVITCAQTVTGTYSTLRECQVACTNLPTTTGATTERITALAAASSCLPPTPPTSKSLDRRACAGLSQTRQVTCHPELKFEGQGVLGDRVAFQNRLSGLRQWYQEHHLNAKYPDVANSSFFMADVANTVAREKDESDAAFALRLWTLISGETSAAAGGVQAALPLVAGKQVMTCTDYKPLCDLALSYSYLRDHATLFGCGLPCNTPGPEMVYNLYYHCGPATDPQRYGYVAGSCTDAGETKPDSTCIELMKYILDGNGTTCQTNNTCGQWEKSPTSDRIYTQTRTCFPSADFAAPASKCCACRGTYAIDRSVTPYVPSCTCDDPTGPPCNFPISSK